MRHVIIVDWDTGERWTYIRRGNVARKYVRSTVPERVLAKMKRVESEQLTSMHQTRYTDDRRGK